MRAKKPDPTNPATILTSVYPWNLTASILGDRPGTDDIEVIERTDAKALEEILYTLTDRERTVLDMRYKYGYTLEKCSQEFGVTRERVRQIEQKALRKMRHPARFKRCILPSREQISKIVDEVTFLRTRKYELEAELENAKKGILEESNAPTVVTDMPIEELELSVRSYNCLRRAGFGTVKDVCGMTYEQLLHIRNLGRKSAFEIVGRLKELGYKLKEDEL